MKKNLKIAITPEQPLDEVVMELERLGYKRKIAPRRSRSDMWIVAFQNGKYDVYRNMGGFHSILTTTLTELKEME